MEQHRDDHIDCTDCGASFVFSAAEASVFAERGLLAPKRCKDCRRARKERAASEGQSGHGRSGPAPHHGASTQGNSRAGSWSGREARGQAPRYGAPPQRRYTGDVNEYRSPMQDGFSGSPGRAGGWSAGQGMAARAVAPRQGAGEYRSPMPDGLTRRGPEGGVWPARARTPGAPARDGNTRVAHDGGRGHDARPKPRAAFGGAAHGAPREAPAASASARRRPQAEMFSITCDACGAQAEVPFKPAEGREVYCPTCYRARRPAP